MRKFVLVASLAGSTLIILDTLNAGQALVMFIFAGILPGTNIAISAGRMLEVFALLLGFTLSRITTIILRNMAQNTSSANRLSAS